MYNPAASNPLQPPSILLQPSCLEPFTNPFYPFVTQLLLNKNILNPLINAEMKTLVNSLELIGNPDGPGASAPDLSPVFTYTCQNHSGVSAIDSPDRFEHVFDPYYILEVSEKILRLEILIVRPQKWAKICLFAVFKAFTSNFFYYNLY